MKDAEIIFAVEESPEGGYEARALGHPIFTQAEAMEELREMVRDSVRCFFEPDAVPAVLAEVEDETSNAMAAKASAQSSSTTTKSGRGTTPRWP